MVENERESSVVEGQIGTLAWLRDVIEQRASSAVCRAAIPLALTAMAERDPG